MRVQNYDWSPRVERMDRRRRITKRIGAAVLVSLLAASGVALARLSNTSTRSLTAAATDTLVGPEMAEYITKYAHGRVLTEEDMQ